VTIEPHLQPITGEQFAFASPSIEDGAQLDTSANSFWVRKLILMLRSLTHVFLPMPMLFTENMNCVRSILMKLTMHEIVGG